MYVLKLPVSEAAEYYDAFHERSFRKINLVVWTLNGDPEPSNYSTSEENDAWRAKQDIRLIDRSELDTLVLADNQELQIDAAVWIQRLPHPKNPTGLALFSHKMYEKDPDDPYPPSAYKRYDMALILHFFDGEEIDRFTKQLESERTIVFGEIK